MFAPILSKTLGSSQQILFVQGSLNPNQASRLRDSKDILNPTGLSGIKCLDVFGINSSPDNPACTTISLVTFSPSLHASILMSGSL
ncbi:MAG: hypothetical protein WC397_02895 [Candidatus Paceibacterota bacterium]|jgi:hypothetical protein